jgi:hypothetical protein
MRYHIPNRNEAANECANRGMKIATLHQLTEAFKLGMDYCSCGFVDEGSVWFPIVTPRYNCNNRDQNRPPGLRRCPTNPAGWSKIGWDAFCIRSERKYGLWLS